MKTAIVTGVTGQDGAYLGLNKRRVKGHKYWKFASTEHIFGGSWAPKGLGDFDYLKDLLGVAGNPDWDDKTGTEEVTTGTGDDAVTTTKLTDAVIESYFQ